MAHARPERRLVVLPFSDELGVRATFGAGRGDEHRTVLRDAARVLQAAMQRAVDTGAVPDGARVVLLLDEDLLADGPLDSRESAVEVCTETAGLDIAHDDTIVVGRPTWAPALLAWRDGDLGRGPAITRLTLDITDFIQNYTKVA